MNVFIAPFGDWYRPSTALSMIPTNQPNTVYDTDYEELPRLPSQLPASSRRLLAGPLPPGW